VEGRSTKYGKKDNIILNTNTIEFLKEKFKRVLQAVEAVRQIFSFSCETLKKMGPMVSLS
jgi:hypothetical protein